MRPVRPKSQAEDCKVAKKKLGAPIQLNSDGRPVFIWHLLLYILNSTQAPLWGKQSRLFAYVSAMLFTIPLQTSALPPPFDTHGTAGAELLRIRNALRADVRAHFLNLRDSRHSISMKLSLIAVRATFVGLGFWCALNS